jgi:hypothetical protein
VTVVAQTADQFEQGLATCRLSLLDGPSAQSGPDRFVPFQPGEGFDRFSRLLPGDPQIIKTLQIEPKVRTGAEKMSQDEEPCRR